MGRFTLKALFQLCGFCFNAMTHSSDDFKANCLMRSIPQRKQRFLERNPRCESAGWLDAKLRWWNYLSIISFLLFDVFEATTEGLSSKLLFLSPCRVWLNFKCQYWLPSREADSIDFYWRSSLKAMNKLNQLLLLSHSTRRLSASWFYRRIKADLRCQSSNIHGRSQQRR